jgi:hypothetical protein
MMQFCMALATLADLLERALERLEELEHEARSVLVIDGSSEREVQLLNELNPSLLQFPMIGEEETKGE